MDHMPTFTYFAHMKVTQHNDEIQQNLSSWNRKPVLREIYAEFHRCIAVNLANLDGGEIIELGSGIGNVQEVIPACVKTDLFPNPWIDRVENAFQLSCTDASVSDLILFDVFHHLRYPGTALQEFRRVLMPGGRVHIFDPYMSGLGRLVYGMFHQEPIGLNKPITWFAPDGWNAEDVDYYAAQGNASRVFFKDEHAEYLCDWTIHHRQRLAGISYVASGGYSKPQLFPDLAYPLMRAIDSLAAYCPGLFATRLLVVLEQK